MKRALGVRDLRPRCEDLARWAIQRGLVSLAEAEAHRPGGERNPDTSAWGWLAYYGRLMAWHEREHVADGLSPRPDQRRGERPAVAADPLQALDPVAERALLDALGGNPMRVALVRPIPGHGAEVYVHPKSLEALEEIHAWDHDVGWLAARLYWLEQTSRDGHARANDVRLIRATRRRLTHLHALLVWILTTGRDDCDAACPYDPARTPDPEAPREWRGVDPYDLAAILRAHQQVNSERLLLLEKLLPTKVPDPDEGAKRAGWSVFVAAAARARNLDPEQPYKRWALTKLVADAALNAYAHVRAEAQAKAEAAAETAKREAARGQRRAAVGAA